jgi:Fe-S-cluster containining protein
MTQLVDVPCGKCRLCCQRQLVILMPEEGDIVENYLHDTIMISSSESAPVLRRKPNGNCIYLDMETGCTIHDRAPVMCRVFDCRRFFAKYGRNERRQMIKDGLADKDIFDRGHELIKQGLPPE